MGAPSGVDVEALKAENEKLKQRVAELEQLLEARVCCYDYQFPPSHMYMAFSAHKITH